MLQITFYWTTIFRNLQPQIIQWNLRDLIHQLMKVLEAFDKLKVMIVHLYDPSLALKNDFQLPLILPDPSDGCCLQIF